MKVTLETKEIELNTL